MFKPTVKDPAIIKSESQATRRRNQQRGFLSLAKPVLDGAKEPASFGPDAKLLTSKSQFQATPLMAKQRSAVQLVKKKRQVTLSGLIISSKPRLLDNREPGEGTDIEMRTPSSTSQPKLGAIKKKRKNPFLDRPCSQVGDQEEPKAAIGACRPKLNCVTRQTIGDSRFLVFTAGPRQPSDINTQN